MTDIGGPFDGLTYGSGPLGLLRDDASGLYGFEGFTVKGSPVQPADPAYGPPGQGRTQQDHDRGQQTVPKPLVDHVGAHRLTALSLVGQAGRTPSIASTTTLSSGCTPGRKRCTFWPSAEIRNFSKFHWISPASPSESGTAVSCS